jgi:hypothetical protein
MYIRLEIGETILKVFQDGKIERIKADDTWKTIENSCNHNKGYNVILINKDQYMRSKIIAAAYLNHDLYDKSVFICHKDNDKMNSNIENLYIKFKNESKK